jgi:hypothetical protein
MAGEKKTTVEEIRARIGEKKEEVLEIDKSMIRAFCECIGDKNPKWRDVAPPGFITNAKVSSGGVALGIPMPYKRIVAAGGEWEFYKPIKVGDKITTVHEFHDMLDKGSEKGPRVLIVYKSTHKNQKGEVVAVTTANVMSY